LRELRKRGHEVEVFTFCNEIEGTILRDVLAVRCMQADSELRQELEAYKPDVLLHWADCTRPNANIGRDLGIPQAICFAGGTPFGPTWNNFDLFFVESDEYKEALEKANVRVITAFGTNTRLWDPNEPRLMEQKRTFDVCFPATFAAWKRHDVFARAVKGYESVCAGYMYPDHEQWCWQVAQKSGTLALPHTPAANLRHVMAASGVCLVTSQNNGGSQRTVLEAMAMNVPVIVMEDSHKTSEYVRKAEALGYAVGKVVPPQEHLIRQAIDECLQMKANGREYVKQAWSEVTYADALEQGLNEICRK
jgi:glycosyltransferase involved in cell wall biosynthesis